MLVGCQRPGRDHEVPASELAEGRALEDPLPAQFTTQVQSEGATHVWWTTNVQAGTRKAPDQNSQKDGR